MQVRYKQLAISHNVECVKKNKKDKSGGFIALYFPSAFLLSFIVIQLYSLLKKLPRPSFPFPSPSVSPLLPPVFLSGLHLVDDKGPVQSPYQSPSVFLCLPVILWSQYTSIHDPPDASCSQSP